MRSGFLGPPPLPPMFRGTTPFLSRLSRPCERPAAGLSELPWASSRPIALLSGGALLSVTGPFPLFSETFVPPAPRYRERARQPGFPACYHATLVNAGGPRRWTTWGPGILLSGHYCCVGSQWRFSKEPASALFIRCRPCVPRLRPTVSEWRSSQL